MSDEADDDEFEIPDEVVVPIEDWIDLHPFRPGEVRSVVEAYLDEALAAGFSEVRLVHGRGIGAQREAVRGLLSRHPRVLDFGDAPPGQGGWGATIVRLSIPAAKIMPAGADD